MSIVVGKEAPASSRFLGKIPTRSILGLDVLRCIAVSLVILHHCKPRGDFFLDWIAHHGASEVDLFFVISGFIITIKLCSHEHFGLDDLKEFYLRRFLRLFPAFFFSFLLGSIWIFAISRKNPESWIQLKHRFLYVIFYMANYDQALRGGISSVITHYWTLAVEEHFGPVPVLVEI
jgi:peptidoglycan/LPS O-acetylase OafA/YrhL